MSEFEIAGERFSYNIISKGDADLEYLLQIEYSGPSAESTATISLGVSGRGDATKKVILKRLREWSENNPEMEIQSFEVAERQVCREGTHLGTVAETDVAAADSDIPGPGVSPSSVSVGDRVAYYVQGPGSTIYGYISEGIVDGVHPEEDYPKVATSGCVELDTGEQSKMIPLAWVVGDATEPAIEDAIDRPRPSL